MTSAKKYSLRKARESDLERLLTLEHACFGANDGAFNRRQLRGLLRNPNAHCLISYDGNSVACWLKCSNGRARWARLYSLAVHPRVRGQGRGRQLLAAGKRWMRKMQLATCTAEAKAENRQALGLYTRDGFEVGRILPHYYGLGLSGIRLRLRIPI